MEGGNPLAWPVDCLRFILLPVLLFGLLLPDMAHAAAGEEPRLFLEITEPANNSLLRFGNIIVSGLTTPGADVTINGEQAYNDNGSFSRGLLFPDGSMSVHVLVENGNETVEKVLDLTIDTTAPRIEILEPENIPPIGDRTVLCRVRSEPDINLTLNGVPMRYEGYGIYSGFSNVSGHTRTITVRATDAAGNQATSSITLIVDPPPAMPEASPLAALQPWMVPTLIIGIFFIAAGLVMRWKRW